MLPTLPQWLQPRNDPQHVVPLWVAPTFLTMAAALLPWIAWLFTTLPDEATAAHWRLAWGGFDVALAGALAATAILVMRRSRFAQLAAAATATMLLCDAWFDVLTSRGTTDVVVASILAVVVELPLAGVCFWLAQRTPAPRC